MKWPRRVCVIAVFFVIIAIIRIAAAPVAAVPQGSPEKARAYYKTLADSLEFKDPSSILESQLDDVLRYLGYAGLSARDLEQLPSAVLMDHQRLGLPCPSETPCTSSVQNEEEFKRRFGVLPLRAGDILAARFLAPKIANVSEGAQARGHGWRKLVRLRSRRNSSAAKNNISAGIILFNFFTKPGEPPFQPGAESVNTQVMLLPTRTSFLEALRKAQEGLGDPRDSLYWLDYGPLSGGGKLSLQLNATFDAGDLQGGPGAEKPYYVPDGCVACHGENPRRPMVNYLDTDHWFDRLNDDFARVRDEGNPVLFDGGKDPSLPQFAQAFDIIRMFNEEAEAQSAFAQPSSFHRRAGRTWLRLHEDSNAHVPPIGRGVRTKIRWNPESEVDKELLEGLNRYCFRCHGTIKFNVFDKTHVYARRGVIPSRLRPAQAQLKANPAFLMPPDRRLPDAEIDRLMQLLKRMEAK